MCGRFAEAKLNWHDAVADDIEVESEPQEQSYNVKPTQPIQMLYDQDGLRVNRARWWFVPHWHRGELKDWKQTTFNARIETASQKPTFRTAWANHRCAIPFQGYYEWTGPKGKKQPWYITAQTNAPCLFFAGLYSKASDVLTTTILTREALPQIADIHHRTPVILTSEEILPWVKGEIGTTAAQNTLGTDWEGRMQLHKVRPFGRDDDGEEVIDLLP